MIERENLNYAEPISIYKYIFEAAVGAWNTLPLRQSLIFFGILH